MYFMRTRSDVIFVVVVVVLRPTNNSTSEGTTRKKPWPWQWPIACNQNAEQSTDSNIELISGTYGLLTLIVEKWLNSLLVALLLL